MDRELRAEVDFDAETERAEGAAMRSKMYEEQAKAFDVIVAAVESGEPAIFFVDGPGGSGKSFLFEALLHYVRGQSQVGIACAWSGLAASLLPGGRTVSSRFSLPVPLPENAMHTGNILDSRRTRKISRLMLTFGQLATPRESPGTTSSLSAQLEFP